MALPIVVFFARSYQAQFFPTLQSEHYRAVFVTLTAAERRRVTALGGEVVGCFEEDYDRLVRVPVATGYLDTSMMADRFLGRFSHAKRIEILEKEVGFWSAILDEYQPSAVVNELVALEISEVLLIEARKRGVQYLAGMNCLVDNYFYWLANPISLSGKYLPQVDVSEQSRAAARRYMDEVQAKDYKPFYVKNLRKRLDPLGLGVAVVKLLLWKWRRLTSVLRGSFRYELYDDEYAKRVSVYLMSLLRGYDRLSDLPRDKDVVFFPLHQEPEATLNYMSEFYANQVATLENIMKCLGANQVLVVKEHPTDKGALLRGKFWELRRNCSGLYYLPAEIHPREVLAVSARVVTLTSTVGWEAAIIGKKVYVLGQIFYDALQGVIPVRSFAELRQQLRSSASGAEPPMAIEQAETFVARMTEISHRGNPFPHPGLYSAENRRLVIDAIARSIGVLP